MKLVKPGSKAAEHPMIQPGHRLVSINGENVQGQKFKRIMKKIKTVPFPRTLEFLVPDEPVESKPGEPISEVTDTDIPSELSDGLLGDATTDATLEFH